LTAPLQLLELVREQFRNVASDPSIADEGVNVLAHQGDGHAKPPMRSDVAVRTQRRLASLALYPINTVPLASKRDMR
jgi:hypothetical protein